MGSKSILRPHKVTEDMAHSLNDAVFKFFLIVTDRQTDDYAECKVVDHSKCEE